MTRVTFYSIFLLWVVTAVHCKKYLIEVADDQGDQGVTQDPAADLQDLLEEVGDESLEEGEETIVDEAIKESESKYI